MEIVHGNYEGNLFAMNSMDEISETYSRWCPNQKNGKGYIKNERKTWESNIYDGEIT